MRSTLSMVALLMLSTAVLAQHELRTITVNGSGSSSVAPDRATVEMSIVATSATVTAAQEAAAAVTAKVLEMTGKLGIDRNRVDTTVRQCVRITAGTPSAKSRNCEAT